MKIIKLNFNKLLFILKLILSINNLELIFIIFLNLLNGILPFITIQLTGHIINNLSIGGNDFYILRLFAIVCILQIISLISEAIYNFILNKFRIRLNLNIENKIINKTKKLKYECFEKSEIYDELKRATIESLSQPYAFLIMFLTITKSAAQISYAIQILLDSKIKNIWLLFFIPLLLILPNLKAINKEHEIIKSHSANFRKKNYFMELLTSDKTIKEVKFFNLGDKFAKKFNDIAEIINKQYLYMYKNKSIIKLIAELMIFSIVIYLQYGSIINTINGVADVGQMIIYFQTISKVDTIVSEIIMSIYSIYQIFLYIQHLYNYLNLELEETYELGVDIGNIKKSEGNKIEFKDVVFTYPTSANKTIKDLSFTVNQGEIISIVGKNGSGKSTILGLMERLYSLNHGNIFYNGIPITEISLNDWRNELCTINQDFIKYEFTLEENICLDDKNDSAKLNKIINILELDTLINTLPNGIKNQLGVKFIQGAQISHGEWQKVAIARSLYKTGSILFLDEPSSALHPDLEKKIFEVLKNLIIAKEFDFIFFITHNYQNLKFSDKVLLLNSGESIAFGTYSEIKDKIVEAPKVYNEKEGTNDSKSYICE